MQASTSTKVFLPISMKTSKGFSMVELLVAMVVGLIIVTGIFSLHSITRETQQTSEAQMDMVADARFAIELISYDLRHAGMWGATNKGGVIACRTSDAICAASADALPAAANDCEGGDWYHKLNQPAFATNNANPYGGNCINTTSEAYQAGTDVLEIRYADSNTLVGGLQAGQTYVRSNYINGKVFSGTTQPLLPANDTGPADPVTRDYLLHAYAYYISDFTDSSGDGIPSLRRVALVSGPALDNQLLVSGVVDLQVQFGEDTVGNDQIVDRYVNPDAVTDWSRVYGAKIWLLLRTDEMQDEAAVKSFTLAGTTANYGGDGFRYFMVSSVVDLKNLKPE